MKHLAARAAIAAISTSCFVGTAFGASALVSWVAPTEYTDDSPLPPDELDSFRLYWRCGAGETYPNEVTVPGTLREHRIYELPEGETCYFVARAVSVAGYSGPLSNEASKTIPFAPVADPITGPTIEWGRDLVAEFATDFSTGYSDGNLVGQDDWQSVSGYSDPEVSSGEVIPGENNAYNKAMVDLVTDKGFSAGVADLEAELDVLEFGTGASSNFASIVLRGQSAAEADSQYAFILAGNGDWSIWNEDEQLASGSYTIGTLPGTMKAVTDGDTLRLYWRGSEIGSHDISADATQYSSGDFAGVYVRQTTSITRVDNFVVRDLVSVGQITESANAASAFSVTAGASASMAESASAQATYSTVAQVAAGLVAAASAQDSPSTNAAASAALTAAASGDELVDAVAQAAAAIIEAASAGESWVADVQATAELVAAGAAAETISGSADGAEQAAISEATTASETFLAAVTTVATLTATASAADAIAGVAAAVGAMSGAGNAQMSLVAQSTDAGERSFAASGAASALYSTVAQVSGALLASLTATAIFTASGAVSAAIAESANAQATFSGSVGGGYLVAGSIAVLAALSGSVNVSAALTGTPSVKPQ